MALRVVGAGLPRTGTLSLKTALERLLGAKCYHMTEVFEHPEHAATWADAAEGADVDWNAFLGGYVAAVDAPSMMMWRELADQYPDALILLSVRQSAEQWVQSMEKTIFQRMRGMRERINEAAPESATAEQIGLGRMFGAFAGRSFAQYVDDPAGAAEYYERHNAEVRAQAPAGRLLEWTAADGWEPLCAALGVPVPDEPFPRVNSSEEFQDRASRLADIGAAADG